jgi:chromosome segregation ATPase
MARKKLAKRVIKPAKSIATVAQLEKDFSAFPAKLTSEINKELSVLKKKENELKKAVAQTASQLKSTESRIKSAGKAKQTATGKKQLAAAKKALQEATKIHRALVSELNSLAKPIADHTTKLAKLTAMRKTLAQFDKDWAKKAKTLKKSVKKSKTKTTRKTATRLKAVKKTKSQQSNIENFNTSVENVTLDQPTEMAS